MGRIIVGMDGSEHAARALELALGLAKRSGQELLLVFVAEPAVADPALMNLVDVIEQQKEFGEAVLRAAVDKAAPSGVTVSTQIRIGRPAECLAEATEVPGVEMIVVGTRGRGALARLLLGSVAHKLIQVSRKPVLVVP